MPREYIRLAANFELTQYDGPGDYSPGRSVDAIQSDIRSGGEKILTLLCRLSEDGNLRIVSGGLSKSPAVSSEQAVITLGISESTKQLIGLCTEPGYHQLLSDWLPAGDYLIDDPSLRWARSQDHYSGASSLDRVSNVPVCWRAGYPCAQAILRQISSQSLGFG